MKRIVAVLLAFTVWLSTGVTGVWAADSTTEGISVWNMPLIEQINGALDSPEGIENAPNGVAVVTVENIDCKKIKNLKDIKVRIYKEGTGIDITIPVEKVDIKGASALLYIGKSQEKISDAVLSQMDSLQGEVNIEEIEKRIGKFMELTSNFSVEIGGLPKGHYVVKSGSFIITNKIVKGYVDLYMKDLSDALGKEIKSFGQMLDEIKKKDSSFGKMPKSKRTAIEKFFSNLDSMVEYLSSSKFTGIVIGGGTLQCNCPKYATYTIEHRYYKTVKGKLKLQNIISKNYRAVEGKKIYVKKYVKKRYMYRTYKYLGSYSEMAAWVGSWNKEYKQSVIRVGNEFKSHVILRYKL